MEGGRNFLFRRREEIELLVGINVFLTFFFIHIYTFPHTTFAQQLILAWFSGSVLIITSLTLYIPFRKRLFQ